MQSVRTDNNTHSDDESLFGSPPPSPGGRGMPTLALPSASLNSEQNVGTLALPGLHNFSELAVSPVVVPLVGSRQARPIQPSLSSSQSQSCSRSTSISSSSSRPRSAVPRTSQTKKRSRENTATPNANQPSIKIPDPNAPLPPNFLRNQQALLGLAGLVGGVNPANLSLQRHTRGTNAQNPIIIEDEHGPPPPEHHYGSRITPTNLSKSRTPPSETIVNQRHLLDYILKLIGSNPFPPLETYPSGDDVPSAKRRRISEVPTGGAGRNTPPSGGSGSYSGGWTDEQGKQLISQFIALIRSAATADNCDQPQNLDQRLDNVNSHYRSVTATYDDPPQPPYTSNQLHSTHRAPTPLDQLVNSMFGSENHSPTSSNTSPVEPSQLEGLVSLLDNAMSEPDGLLANPVIPPTSSFMPDSLIDPVLLGLSVPNLERSGASSSSSVAGGSTPRLTASPVPSSSSVMDPATPNYDTPIFPEPGVTSGDSGAFLLRDSNLFEDLMRRRMPSGWATNETRLNLGVDRTQRPLDPSSSLSMPIPGSLSLSDVSPSDDARTVPTPTQLNGLGSNLLPTTLTRTFPIVSTPSQLSCQQTFQTSAMQAATSNTSRLVPPTSANATKQRREQLIQRAKEMRRRLVGEIGKSKVELWEMTIEQGVLAQLAKDDALAYSTT